jgi:splicing factor U2AF 65 kDa subunit
MEGASEPVPLEAPVSHVPPAAHAPHLVAAAKAEEEPKLNRDDQVEDADKDREKSRSPVRRSKSRSRSPSRSRSRSRDRRQRRSRSRSRDRRNRRRSRSRSRSRDRGHRRRRYSRSRSRSRSRDRYNGGGGGGGGRRDRRRRGNRNNNNNSDDEYGYRPRRRRGSSIERARMAAIEDPFAKLRAQTAAAAAASNQFDPAAIARQMQEQQLRARQLVLHQQAASAVIAASKTQREVYVGNLTPGVVTDPMLRQLFNATLQAAFPEQCDDGSIEPVIHIKMASEGKYCFIELLSSDMANSCLELSGQVMLAGSMLSIGRPAGYVDPVRAQAASEAAAEALARFQYDSQKAKEESGVEVLENDSSSPFLVAEGMITAGMFENDQEYNEVVAEIREEFEVYGTVLRMVVPRPSKEKNFQTEENNNPTGAKVETEKKNNEKNFFSSGNFGKVFVQYLEVESAQKAKESVDGRLFSGQTVRVSHMQAEAFMKAVGQKIV